MATKLNHGDLIRLADWNHVTFATAGSVEGYARYNGDNADEALSRAIANKHDIVWSSYIGGAIVKDDGSYHAAQKAKAAAAVTLAPGEVVEIEGRTYRVRVLPRCSDRPRFSDPIKFDAIDAA